MSDYDYFVGIDWGRERHHVCLVDHHGQKLAEHSFKHGGIGLNSLAEWISDETGNSNIAIAIEVPHGPVVETLMERDFKVYSINPGQLDRFRDRVSPAGVKDDRLDAYVLATSLRTDGHRFRYLRPTSAAIVELRELSRSTEHLTANRVRLVNRIRQLLWRYYPQFLELEKDLSKLWVRELWQRAPTPKHARRLRKTTVDKLLGQHRVRRISADETLKILRTPPMALAPGTAEAICTSLRLAFDQLMLNERQTRQVHAGIDELIRQLSDPEDNESAIHWQRDVAILSSIPRVGRVVLATLLAEASEPLKRRDLKALRCLCGVAPVTRRSGKSNFTVKRTACNHRLRNAIYHWALIAMQHDQISKAKYNTLRARGHGHARALRTVGDRLLGVACAMLENQSEFNRNPIQHREAA